MGKGEPRASKPKNHVVPSDGWHRIGSLTTDGGPGFLLGDACYFKGGVGPNPIAEQVQGTNIVRLQHLPGMDGRGILILGLDDARYPVWGRFRAGRCCEIRVMFEGDPDPPIQSEELE